MNEHSSFTADDAQSAMPRDASRGVWNRLRPILAFIQVRARFLVALAAICLVVGQWERISATWQWATRQLLGSRSEPSAVSSDTEFFCPMDPGVVSPWEDKCPICNMSLVRRKKGTAQALPKGVVARMQVSPYRLQLAGIQTAPVDFLPLRATSPRSALSAKRRGPMVRRPSRWNSVWPSATCPSCRRVMSAEVRLAHAESPPARGELLAIDAEQRSALGQRIGPRAAE